VNLVYVLSKVDIWTVFWMNSQYCTPIHKFSLCKCRTFLIILIIFFLWFSLIFLSFRVYVSALYKLNYYKRAMLFVRNNSNSIQHITALVPLHPLESQDMNCIMSHYHYNCAMLIHVLMYTCMCFPGYVLKMELLSMWYEHLYLCLIICFSKMFL
jgi:hypothetical protein